MRCAICGRDEVLTRHHLVPKARHANKRNKRKFTREEVRRVVMVCRPCHSQIHAQLTEKQIERDYATVEALRGHPEIAKFAEWIALKPPGFRPKSRRPRNT